MPRKHGLWVFVTACLGCSTHETSEVRLNACVAVEQAASAAHQTRHRALNHLEMAIDHNRHAMELGEAHIPSESCEESLRVGRLGGARGAWLEAWMDKERTIAYTEASVRQEQAIVASANIVSSLARGADVQRADKLEQSLAQISRNPAPPSHLLETTEFGASFPQVLAPFRSWVNERDEATGQVVALVMSRCDEMDEMGR